MTIFTTLEIAAKTPTGIPVHTDKIPVPVGEDPNKYFQASEMNMFNTKINANTSDVRKLMENSNEINIELLKRLKIVQVVDLAPGTVWNYPAANKNDAWIINIVNDKGVQQPGSSIWLGGYTGVSAGHNSIVIAKQASTGGTFDQVGDEFLIINQRVQTVIQRVDHYADLQSPGNLNYIYWVEDTGNTYIWSVDVIPNDYVLTGSIIEGNLIDNETFHDLSSNPVTGDGSKVYFDVTEEIYYRWNGEQFVPINFTTGGGGEYDWTYLGNQKHLKYNSTTQRPENSNSEDTPTGVSITGDVRAKAFLGRATAHDISTAFLIDANDLSEMYHLNLTGHTNIEITNRTNGLTGIVTAWAKGTYNLNFVNLVHEEDSSLGYDGTMWNLIVMEWSDTASHNLGTWKVVSQMPI